MAELLTPNQDFGWLRADAGDLDRKLRDGDGLSWAGDRDLDLRQGVVEEVKSGRPTGKILARRWEVWRHCEDGLDRIIGHWRMEEFDRIIYDLVRMRAEAPAHVDVSDAIDKANAANEDKIWGPGRDALGNAMEHMARLAADREDGKRFFGYGGNPGSSAKESHAG